MKGHLKLHNPLPTLWPLLILQLLYSVHGHDSAISEDKLGESKSTSDSFCSAFGAAQHHRMLAAAPLLWGSQVHVYWPSLNESSGPRWLRNLSLRWKQDLVSCEEFAELGSWTPHSPFLCCSSAWLPQLPSARMANAFLQFLFSWCGGWP